ncbi:MAG: hypothetical protein KJ600_05325 [Nanoarchaeota archaeon]|nr:hypothetical protein [Nanoarchaeota archaeon]
MGPLIEEIKNKKELKSLNSDFVGSITKELLEGKKINIDKKSERKKIIKEVRSILHAVYGVFKKSKYTKKEKLLKDISSLKDTAGHNKILELHRSTKERLEYYPSVYEKIFAITGKPKSILDLGCGLNPLSYPYMRLKTEYYATELTEEDSKFIQSYFDKLKIKGKAYSLDLTRINTLPPADVCFLFKLLDTLETLKRDITKTIFEQLQTKWVVASFPLKTIGGRKNISKRRLVWFEKIIKDCKYETFEIPNEVFYVIKLASK